MKLNNFATKLDLPLLTIDDVNGLDHVTSRTDKVPAMLIRFAEQPIKAQWIVKLTNVMKYDKNINFFEYLSAKIIVYCGSQGQKLRKCSTGLSG